MKKSKNIIAIVAGLAVFAVAGASAATLSPAQITYNKSIAKAKAIYLAQIKPAQDAVIKAGKVAETKRRAKVALALSSYSAIVLKAKAPVLAAEAQYRTALKASIANPNDAGLKIAKQNAITVLAKATLNLKKSTTVSLALKNFNATRLKAFKDFKASLAKVLTARIHVRAKALATYNVSKKKALAILTKANKAPTK
jgi:hypothetical protein